MTEENINGVESTSTPPPSVLSEASVSSGNGYENFNPADPYNEANVFKPAMCIDLKKGDAWFGGGTSHFNADGSGYLAGGNLRFDQAGRLFAELYTKTKTTYILESSANVMEVTLPSGGEGIVDYVNIIRVPFADITRLSTIYRFVFSGNTTVIYKDSSGTTRSSNVSPVELSLPNKGWGYYELTGWFRSDSGIVTWIIDLTLLEI